MSGAVAQAVEAPRPAAAAAAASAAPASGTSRAAAAAAAARGAGGCGVVRKPGPATMEHVLLALRETEAEREARIRGMFGFFDASGRGHLDQEQIEAGLAALHLPPEGGGKGGGYALELLRACDRDRDGRVGYDDFRRYMDDKELELYRIFQAIDVEHNGCILPEELWHALVKAGIEIDDEELARFVEHVDKDNNGIITFEEWRDFLLLYPHEATMENIYHHWERVCLVDIGEQAAIPERISKHVAPESAIRFYAYEMLKEYIMKSKGENKSDIGTSGRLMAGGLAGAVAQTAIYPIDLVKTRLQTFASGSGKIPSLSALSRDIWVQEGPRAFYRGLVPSLLGMVPYAGIDLTVYETLKEMSKTYVLKDSDPGPLLQLGCGTVSGALGATCVYPLQVIRTR
ncbi:hypothetical protein GUJ93_ZPchr0002g26757 [Zizania palustris]|nr:hypothetical protein GUJ93_ZPchr0002g26757 [Zizania palustris]